jgi:hypothetical protein
MWNSLPKTAVHANLHEATQEKAMDYGAPSQPPVKLMYYATQPRGVTLDADAAGGNPFATALIELAGDSRLRLRDLAPKLQELTNRKSNGRQVPESVIPANLPDWSFQESETQPRERRDALILIVSDYSGSKQRSALAGAAWDERRISAMLASHGFSVTQGAGASRASIVQALSAFKRHSVNSDVAIVYSTGHGLELNGEAFLIPGDYPASAGDDISELRRFAIGVNRIAASASSAKLNLVFFAGCRTAPRKSR